MRQASLPLENLRTWAHFNDVRLFEASIEPRIVGEDGNEKGGGLQADAEHGPGKPFVAVPLDLVLSKERVEQCAKADQHLKGLIEAAPSLFKTPRTAVLLFLVYQMTINCPDCQGHGLGVSNPFADYVKMLPHDILLPTFYTSEERDLLSGTSLSDALEQKLISLEREFDSLKAFTAEIPWCQKIWWDDRTGCLSVEDWKLADAMYRSRALELPRGAGLGMVPVVDMANHAADERYNARFEVDEETQSVLLVARDNRTVKRGDEITIMYGCGGACEMIFSYGFLEEHASSAREMFLGLSIPTDDPLRVAKIRFAQEAPGVRIYVDDSDQVHWESTFVWWACVNQEDGLDFRVERTLDGNMELQALWKDEELNAAALQSTLENDRLRDVFVLRAVVMIQERVEQQGTKLATSEGDFQNTLVGNQVRVPVYQTIGRLRTLEIELLARAYEMLDTEKANLLESSVVRTYLGIGQPPTTESTGIAPEDFS
ncbi:hypothetical protein G647_08576 [Cladophialophora carrionii CBS 160.54]|uniref:SET domain-containing protein n=1 Tax=Cladophialophora carrionii CBS 160.54 TaxID=1279043 RepID=V9D0T3_9EURO|nr:uncharacterized protein G647_08576 [Cladophialophora carrionii CBS 160.54]ETI20539.1 hypothetical protein G647_08576 [Cladophialophora carrionii CBS 160.54]